MSTCSACGKRFDYPIEACLLCGGQRRIEPSTAQPAPDTREAELAQLRGRVAKLEPILAAVEEWADNNEGVPSNANDCGLIKALWTFEGDRKLPCEECEGDCGEPCAPCTVAEAHAILDEFADKFRAETQKANGSTKDE